MEEYKCIFEDYEISNFGNCRRKMKKGGYNYLKGSVDGSGYRYLRVAREGKIKNKKFHHLVAEAFIGERPEGLVIDHIDRNKLNNNVSNLRYISQQENCCNQHRYRTDITTNDPEERQRIFVKEWRETNPEYQKEYREANQEQIAEYNREWRDANPEYDKAYRDANRERIAEQKKEKHNCECGGKYTYVNKATHFKSKKHLNRLASHTPPVD